MVNKDNLSELPALLEYVAKFQPKDIEDLYTFYRMQFDAEKLLSMVIEPPLLDGVMRFFSIGILTRIEELLDEKKRAEEMN